MSLACQNRLARRAQIRLIARFVALLGLASLVTLLGAITSASAQANPGGENQSIYTCPTGATLDGDSCITNATSVWVPGEYLGGAGPVGSCPPEWELDGIFCYQTPTTSAPACPEGGSPAPGDDGAIGRCVADAVAAQPQCPAGYLPVDDTCFAEPIDAFTCPDGGEADPDEIADDGTVLACRAESLGAAAGCPTNYQNIEGVCTAAAVEADAAAACSEGELIDGQCRKNAKFMSGPNATCNGEPTSKPASECGTWKMEGGDRVPAIVNTRPTPVPVPMRILGEDTGTAIDLTPTQTPTIVLNSANTDATSSGETPQLDLSAGGDAAAETATQTDHGFTLSTPSATPLSPSPTGEAALGATTSSDAPSYQWGSAREDAPKGRTKLAFTGSAAKPLVVTALGMMVSGFMAVEFNRRLRKHDARKHLPRRFR